MEIEERKELKDGENEWEGWWVLYEDKIYIYTGGRPKIKGWVRSSV